MDQKQSDWNKSQQAHWDKSRKIVKRLVITGTLELLSPTGLGNGDTNGITDMSLLYDPQEGDALLTGASIAGALRNYLWEIEQGFEERPDRKNKRHQSASSTLLFGSLQGDPEGEQSLLIVDDALSQLPKTELRDGVRIDPITRTAKAGQKFDLELLQAGTTFPIRFELLIPISADSSQDQEGQPSGQQAPAISKQEQELRTNLALALSGLENPDGIHLGVRKRRGFGECKVKTWTLAEYDLTQPSGLSAWLNESGQSTSSHSVAELLLGNVSALTNYLEANDQRQWFRLRATLGVESSLLVRSGSRVDYDAKNESAEAQGAVHGPDAVHLHRLQQMNNKAAKPIPVLPGTSAAGVLRHRALRIAQTIHPMKGEALIQALFGEGPKGKGDRHKGSRIHVKETEIENATSQNILVQNRIRIDRFTGGVLDNYLFDEAPLFGNDEIRVQLNVAIHKPRPAEIGLMLLVLKDIWTGDLAFGSGANIGRGTMIGHTANLSLHMPSQKVTEFNGETSSQTSDKQTDKMDSFDLTIEAKQHINNQPMLSLSTQRDPSKEQSALRKQLQEYVDAFVAWTPTGGTA